MPRDEVENFSSYNLASAIPAAHVFTMSDLFAPWITDPDPPEDPMSSADAARAAKALAAAYPDLIDRSLDGPIYA